MRSTFPSQEELREMPVALIRLIDIQDTDEERLVQDILNEKFRSLPLDQDVYTGDVPDIKTKEEEEYWQKILDDRRQKKILASQGPDADFPLDNEDPVPTEVAPETPSEPGVQEDPIKEPESVKKFCEFCDAKGPISHKKDCPTRVGKAK